VANAGQDHGRPSGVDGCDHIAVNTVGAKKKTATRE